MKNRKFFAVVMAAVMTLSMAACGGEQTSNDVTPTTAPTATTAPTQAPVADPTATPVPEPQNVTIADASITFEDGNFGFVDAYMQHARSANLELSLVDYNGSKAVKVVNTTGTSKVPYIAIDVSSLFGADVSKIAGMELVVGTSSDDGKFYSVSGEFLSWWGAEREEAKLGTWSVYMEKKNPKINTAKVPAGCEFVADANNIMIFGVTTDNAAADTGAPAVLYIDDIRFYDAAGNTMKPADTTVAFNWPESTGPDLSNLYVVSNAVEFPGFTTKGAGWGQDGFEMPQEIIDALVPGSVVEISFKSDDGSMWIVMPDATAGWSRIAQGKAYINNSKTVAQIPYEAFVEVCGEDKTTWGARMQCEAAAAWEVYSVKVGTASKRLSVANAVEFPDFVKSGAGWAQDGLEMPQEIIDALVPGSVVEIDYSSEDGALWIVMPDATAGWSRCAQGTAVCDGKKAYITYEQIAAVCGEDKSTWGARMQCEGSAAWEVYGVRVGTKVEYPVIGGFVEFPDFVKSGAGWAQDGLEMPQEIIDALVPGAVVEITFSSEDDSMWIVMPDAAAGWSRCAQGTAAIADGKAYITYEQIAAVCGEDKSTWGARMQCEAATAWEVYAVRVGQGPLPAGTDAPVVEEPAAPAVADPVITAADGKGTVVAADASWWTQIALTKEELLAGVAEENVTGFKFTGDTDFIIAYNDAAPTWIQKDPASSFELALADINMGGDYYFCFVLSKGDSVVYNLAWEVLAGEAAGTATEETPAVEETPAAAAEGVTGTFSGAYVGDYGAEWIPLDAFAGCDNGAVVTINFTRAGAAENYANTWWNFTFFKNVDGWPKFTDAKYYSADAPAFSEWGFIDMNDTSVTTFTTTVSAEMIAELQAASSNLGIQVCGFIPTDYTVTPVK